MSDLSHFFTSPLKTDEKLGIYLNFDFNSMDEETKQSLELDYQWDYLNDRTITSTIIHEWDFLDILIGRLVTHDASSVLSIGGGGNSKTHLHLKEKTSILFVVNTGLWDLKTYPTRHGTLEIVKIRGVGEELPFKDASIEAIEIPSTLDHVLDPTKVIAESFRILKLKGKIGITLGNEQSWYRRLCKLLRIQFADNHNHAHNFHFKPEDVEDLLRDAGFYNVRTIGTAYLKIPKFLERRITRSSWLTIHRVISNVIMKFFFSRFRGGMFLVVGEKIDNFESALTTN